jgi:hypothetical protein
MDWNAQVSLFDVNDFSNPRLADAYSLAMPAVRDGWTYAWSEATWEHKAFQYWKGKLAVPVSSYRWVDDCGREDRYAYGCYDYYSRLEILNVGDDEITLHGSIDHSDFFTSESYWSYRDVRRSIFMGDYIYAIGDRGITAHRLADMAETARVELRGTTDEMYWIY